MKKLLAPFDREFKQVPETINMQSSLSILLSKKSLIERFFFANPPQIHRSGLRKTLSAGIEVWQQL